MSPELLDEVNNTITQAGAKITNLFLVVSGISSLMQGVILLNVPHIETFSTSLETHGGSLQAVADSVAFGVAPIVYSVVSLDASI